MFTATVTVTHEVELDVDALVKEYGQVARTKRWLMEYVAGGNGWERNSGIHVVSNIVMEPKPKAPAKRVRKGVGSY